LAYKGGNFLAPGNFVAFDECSQSVDLLVESFVKIIGEQGYADHTTTMCSKEDKLTAFEVKFLKQLQAQGNISPAVRLARAAVRLARAFPVMSARAFHSPDSRCHMSHRFR
jgi:hypothetical protein